MTGRIQQVIDSGSVVMVFIRTGRGRNARTVALGADGNAWRRGPRESGMGAGDRVEFEVNDWGGLATIQFA